MLGLDSGTTAGLRTGACLLPGVPLASYSHLTAEYLIR